MQGSVRQCTLRADDRQRSASRYSQADQVQEELRKCTKVKGRVYRRPLMRLPVM